MKQQLTAFLTSLQSKLSLLGRRIRAYYPAILPRGRAQFDAWATSIIELLDKELAEVPDIQKRFVLATMLINLDKKADRYTRRYFIKQMNKAATNQVAAQFFQEVQQAEAAEKQTQQANKQAGATATPLAVAPRGQG